MKFSMTLFYLLCVAVGLVGAVEMKALPDGEYRLRAEALRLQELHVRLPEGTVLAYTGQDDPETTAPWQVHLTKEADQEWRLHVEQVTPTVRRTVDYWLFVPHVDTSMGPMEPLFASEMAFTADTGRPLFRMQTMDWIVRYRASEYPVVMERVASWILRHLPEVYDFDILAVCSEYFWHGGEPNAPGFQHCIACNQRVLEVDPQAIDLYTQNAWLLWSDWCNWRRDPNSVPGAQGHLDMAVELIQQGRAANPDNAEYYFDAANTLSLAAQSYSPELMDMVIRYYLQAEQLTTDLERRVQVRNILGHKYRRLQKDEEAIRWYRAAQALDADNKVSLRFLKQLKAVPFVEEPNDPNQ